MHASINFVIETSKSIERHRAMHFSHTLCRMTCPAMQS
ncbi:hypothetical protein BVI434_410070 [Burkholderia vietnamiensis]|nr:hypothetical protein BVI434_410070 [Burkholderia vietnamiensis]